MLRIKDEEGNGGAGFLFHCRSSPYLSTQAFSVSIACLSWEAESNRYCSPSDPSPDSMAKSLLSPPPFFGTPLPSLSRHGLPALPHGGRRIGSLRVKFSFHEIPPPLHPLESSVDFSSIVSRAESLLYTLADAAVAVDPSSGGAASTSTDVAVQKSGGWFGFISDAMEFVLKVMHACFFPCGLRLIYLSVLFQFLLMMARNW